MANLIVLIIATSIRIIAVSFFVETVSVKLWCLGCSLLDSFLCNDQSCIDRVKVCNLRNDCPDGEDEIGCEAEVSCGPNQLRCHKALFFG